LDDLIVGSIEASPSGKSRAGKSYVIFGKIDNTVINLSALGTGGFVINGEKVNDYSGISASNAGYRLGRLDKHQQSNHPSHRR
jgi:hypothetical protein